jgi:hypothetical protein
VITIRAQPFSSARCRSWIVKCIRVPGGATSGDAARLEARATKGVTFRDSNDFPATEVQCGWLKDKFGLSWQIVPARLPDLIRNPKAMQAMMKMKKLDIAEKGASSIPPHGIVIFNRAAPMT